MRRILLLFLLLTNMSIYGQMQSKMDIALRYLEKNSKQMGLSPEDYKDMLLTFQSTDANGISYVYFNQTVDGIPIKNAILNFTINKNGKIESIGNTFVSNKNQKLSSSSNVLKVERAFEEAAAHLGFPSSSPGVAVRADDKITFNKSKLLRSPATAQLKYAVKDGQLLKTWELTMEMAPNSDYWEIRMDATSGKFVSKNNLTIYCSHHKDKFARHTHNCEAHSYKKLSEQSVKVEDVLSGAAGYKVYALPAESPLHGAHTIVTDPHYTEVSPFGWHDINGVEGPEFTITKGNNVDAFVDKDDDDAPDADEDQPDGGEALSFNFNHDLSKEPVQSPAAAQTNLFYMVNMMHDIMALYGFDEEAGNFQNKNYSNKGKGGDYVLAQAFDGFKLATPTLNNANFSTPPDGGNGRMQMFLWDTPLKGISINSPETIKSYVTEFGVASFGVPIPKSTDPPITGEVVIARDNTGSFPTQCCKPAVTDINGKIALIDRGSCDFSQKAKYAEDKGAIAVIICNIVGVNGGTGEEIVGTMGTGNSGLAPENIPSIFLKKSQCDIIRAEINKGEKVEMTFVQPAATGPLFLDGAFDNGIIAHEFGHGISTRLTGGPANSSCLGNAEQMGEGWSDFFSLIVTVEPGDKGSDIRGIGTFANGEAKNGRGIRRFPYSTDMTVNPQTFDDIKGQQNAQGVPAVHNIGEIWTDCLWDLHWKLVDKYGYDANWRNFESGNAKTLKLVIQAMKIQGCDPGFIRGRNAILDADSLLYNGENGYDIWEVFARRGLGWAANGGDANNINDGTENFEPNPYQIAKLKIKKDEIELIKPESQVEILLNTINHVPSLQSGVVIKDQMPPGFSYVDNSATVPATITSNEIILQLGDIGFDKSNTVKYKLKSGPEKSLTLYPVEGFEGDVSNWISEIGEGIELWFASVDDKKSGEYSFYAINTATETDQYLISPSYNIVGNNPTLRIWHKFETEAGSDGGFIEISEDGGNAWQIVRDGFIKNGYNGELAYATLAIPSLKSFTGTSNGEFIDSYLDLSPWKGKEISFRFRFASDDNTAPEADFPGWYIDDFEIMDLKVYETVACIENGDGENGSCSVIRKFILDSDGFVAVKDLDENISYEVYPNPADQFVVVDLNSKGSDLVTLSIISSDGRTVYNEEWKINSGKNIKNLDTSPLTSGMYFLKMVSGNKQQINKILIH